MVATDVCDGSYSGGLEEKDPIKQQKVRKAESSVMRRARIKETAVKRRERRLRAEMRTYNRLVKLA